MTNRERAALDNYLTGGGNPGGYAEPCELHGDDECSLCYPVDDDEPELPDDFDESESFSLAVERWPDYDEDGIADYMSHSDADPGL
jgi:hypothetical protein